MSRQVASRSATEGRSSDTRASTHGSTADRPSSCASLAPTAGAAPALRTRVSDEAAVFFADILPTGFGAMTRAGVLSAGGKRCCGCWLRPRRPDGGSVCGRRRAPGVIAIDGIEERRTSSRGGRSTRPVDPPRPPRRCLRQPEGLGADVVIEAAGVQAALDASLELARSADRSGRRRALQTDYPLGQRP